MLLIKEHTLRDSKCCCFYTLLCTCINHTEVNVAYNIFQITSSLSNNTLTQRLISGT